MLIKPNLRILTVGDGDLSFSSAIVRYHRPKLITATIFDSLADLEKKYGMENFSHLTKHGANLLSEFDVTDPESWQGLGHQQFDLVIFQFPLIPNDISEVQHLASQQLGDANLRHRLLLRCFLINAQRYFLDPNGARLAVITSKDVKPYRQWDIEQSLTLNTSMEYLGQRPFNFDDFLGYQIRNVDRDKFVNQTQGISYYYSDTHQHDLGLSKPRYLTQDSPHYCGMCRVGPMLTKPDQVAHQQSKRHVKMSGFDSRWRAYLSD